MPLELAPAHAERRVVASLRSSFRREARKAGPDATEGTARSIWERTKRTVTDAAQAWLERLRAARLVGAGHARALRARRPPPCARLRRSHRRALGEVKLRDVTPDRVAE